MRLSPLSQSLLDWLGNVFTLVAPAQFLKYQHSSFCPTFIASSTQLYFITKSAEMKVAATR